MADDHSACVPEELLGLRSLVDQLRARMPPLTRRESADIGHYILRAFQLGQGASIEEVTRPVTYDDEPASLGRRTHLKLVPTD